ncbi:MAG: hypothetical protein LBQ79_11040 [Deltaproteobacteria bacterium]|jgi:hypothetical protein|nr:hypothetical protein [Deltaproteobacteria bacterium]
MAVNGYLDGSRTLNVRELLGKIEGLLRECQEMPCPDALLEGVKGEAGSLMRIPCSPSRKWKRY